MNLPIFACPSCSTPLEHETTIAVGNAIWFMIGITAVVLTGITWMIVHSIRAANREKN